MKIHFLISCSSNLVHFQPLIGCYMPMLAWKQMLRLGVIGSPKCHAMTVTRGFCIGFYSEGAASKLASFDLFTYYDSLNSKMQLFLSSKTNPTMKTTSNNNMMAKNTEREVASKIKREMHRRKEKRQRRPDEIRANTRVD